MKDINDKFDRAETYIERFSKLILKIVTTLAALIVGIIFAWNQLKTTINEHVHQEDKQFQQYLKEIESEEVYEGGVVDSAYEDSLYNVYYNLTTEAVADTVVPTPELIADTSVIDTPTVTQPIQPVTTQPIITPIVVTLEVRETLITETEVIDTPIITDMVVDTTVTDTVITDTTITDTIEVRE